VAQDQTATRTTLAARAASGEEGLGAAGEAGGSEKGDGVGHKTDGLGASIIAAPRLRLPSGTM
jgi:hypothetical protein